MIKFNNLSNKNEINLSLPDINIDLMSILDNTPLDRIFLSSDWHIGQNHYKHEKNFVNTQNIITWCRQNIKENDVFMYLGDLIFRYSNKEDQEKAAKIYASIPGIKILILGNHDRMLGDEFYTKCGFDFVFEEYTWKNLIFTHRPIIMTLYPDNYLNVHGHIHNIKAYNTTDGKRNVNVYPLWYGNKPVTLKYILDHIDELVKDNYWNANNGVLGEQNSILENERDNLPDSAFGIPEQRKYPLDSKKHVQSAIKLFGYAEEKNKKELAKNIKDAARKYDLTIPETTQCYKYLNEGGIEDMIPEDITTIVFDMGAVLVDGDIFHNINNGIAVSDITAHEIYDLVIDNLFNYDRNKFDLDHYSVEQIKEYFYNLAPSHIKPYTNQIFDMFEPAMFVFEYVDEMLTTLRTRGYSIYYLSNWAKWSYELEETFFRPLLNKLDGGMFSFESKYAKPDHAFYNEFFDKFGLDPEKCFFFDDKPENIIAGVDLGMKGMLFDCKETPKLLLRDNFTPPSEVNNTILINTGAKLEAVDMSEIKSWFCSEESKPGYISEVRMHKTLEEAIFADVDEEYFNSLSAEPIERYVFVCNEAEDCEDANRTVLVGKILVYPDRRFTWIMQYPIAVNGSKYVNPVVKEWSMASVNPIVSAKKPFILKVTNDAGMFSPVQYLFSPDIISDKYMIVNEDAKLEIVDANRFENCYFEVYEFIGNKAYLNKLYEAYKNGKIVDNTAFYTILTGKPMLCEDQIDFDPNFRKVDFEAMIENFTINFNSASINNYLN